MLENIKIKILILLLAATLIIPAFLMAYQPKESKSPRLAEDLWVTIESSHAPEQKAMAHSKDFPGGFRDASMGKAVAGPIKVEGG
ncbi:MAG: hypothetical protein A2V86_16490 [Deltaproteobacteria bacterium RBG_16_49_23]|nr:MAG: hypothetical protein A2V86_16490 [Deltaproteobacteria bacterium RBG_16_49_23]